MADRYDVLLFLDDAKQAQISESFNLPAFDVIHALQEAIRINGIAPGRYIAQTIHGTERASGWVEVRDGGALTIGPRWGLPTPIEPIDRADLGVDVGVPDVV